MNGSKRGTFNVDGVLFSYQVEKAIPGVSDKVKVQYHIEQEIEVDKGFKIIETVKDEVTGKGKDKKVVQKKVEEKVPMVEIQKGHAPRSAGSFDIYCRLSPMVLRRMVKGYALALKAKDNATTKKIWGTPKADDAD